MSPLMRLKDSRKSRDSEGWALAVGVRLCAGGASCLLRQSSMGREQPHRSPGHRPPPFLSQQRKVPEGHTTSLQCSWAERWEQSCLRTSHGCDARDGILWNISKLEWWGWFWGWSWVLWDNGDTQASIQHEQEQKSVKFRSGLTVWGDLRVDQLPKTFPGRNERWTVVVLAEGPWTIDSALATLLWTDTRRGRL